MSDETIAKKAFSEAEKEMSEDEINRIKGIVKSTLQEIESSKERMKTEQEIQRVLKLDLEDLRNGRLDAIYERQKESLVARKYSKVIDPKQYWYVSPGAFWPVTGGTYTITNGMSGTTTFYLQM